MISHPLKDWLAAGFCTAVGGTLFLHYSWSVIEGWRSRRWPTVSGEVTTSEIDVYHTRLGRSYEPSVRYVYSLAGTSYVGKRVRFGDVDHMFRSNAEAHLAPYPAGAQVDVRYHSQHPSRAVLEPGASIGTMFKVPFFGTMFALGIGLLLGILQ